MSQDRFDELLEQRFSAVGKRKMAQQVLAHDAQRNAPEQEAAFDADHIRRRMRFRGAVPEPLQRLLQRAVPKLLLHAAKQGLRLRDLNHEIHIFQRQAYEQERGHPVPASVHLPAASFVYDQLYRLYTVRVVLSTQPTTLNEAVAVLRLVIARLLGEIWLREEVFTREVYREDLVADATADASVTAALEDQIRLLREVPVSTPELKVALVAHARQRGFRLPKMATQARQSFLDQALHDAAHQALEPEREEPITIAFDRYVEALRHSPEAALGGSIEVIEQLNKQLNFLPPDEEPQYRQLKSRKPTHFLRAAKLRLEHELEVMGTLEAGYAEAEEGHGLSPLTEEQVAGHLSDLRRQGLARPYLLQHARLSTELATQRDAFAFEVHGILGQLPPAENPERAFNALRRRITRSLYQRLYTALVDLQTWARAAERGHHDGFLAGKRYQALKAQVSNFRFRRPLLEGLNVRLGIVLDALEVNPAVGSQSAHRNRFPITAFSRAWSYFVSYRITGETLAAEKQLLPQFNPGRYWATLEDSVARLLASGPPHYRIVALLVAINARAGDEGLALFVDLLGNPPGTLRYMLNQALGPAAGSTGGLAGGLAGGTETSTKQQAPPTGKELEQKIAHWAETLLQAHAQRLQNRIVLAEPE